jgi:hypothetical protein
MRQGIHLGPPQPKLPAMARALGAALFALAATFGLLALRAGRDVMALRAEVARLDEEMVSVTPLDSNRPAVASRLRAVLASGWFDAVVPTEALQLLGNALPVDVTAVNVTLHASAPNRSLTLEATATGASGVTELQRRISSSPMASGTTLLEERRLPDGKLAIRLQVDLRGSETR